MNTIDFSGALYAAYGYPDARMREQWAYHNLREEIQMMMLDKLGIADTAWAGLITLDVSNLATKGDKRFKGRDFSDAVRRSVPDGESLLSSCWAQELGGMRCRSYSRVQVRIEGSKLARHIEFRCEDEKGWPPIYALGVWNQPEGGECVLMLPVGLEGPLYLDCEDTLRLDLNIGT